MIENWLSLFGMLKGAAEGLVTERASILSYDMLPKPSRYFRTPTGPTNRISRTMYVTTIATDVLRDRAEQSRPIVEVARQVVAMIARKTPRVQRRSRSSGISRYARRSCSVSRNVRTVDTRS